MTKQKPSQKFKLELEYKNRPKSTEANNITGISKRYNRLSKLSGNMKAVRPRTKEIFAMFEPITLPKAISGCPFKAAYTLTISSGAEVAKETTVKPITTIETFIRIAKAIAPLTRNSPPTMSAIKPIIKYKTSSTRYLSNVFFTPRFTDCVRSSNSSISFLIFEAIESMSFELA